MRPPTDSEATDSGPVRLCALEGLDPDAPGAEAFGGKALGLARLRRDGVSTPAGFAVSASTVDPASWPADVRDDFARRAEALLAAGPVAVRSSARGEDGEERSFAGLFESELDRGTLDEVWAAAARCVAWPKAQGSPCQSGRPLPRPGGRSASARLTRKQQIATTSSSSAPPRQRGPGSILTSGTCIKAPLSPSSWATARRAGTLCVLISWALVTQKRT